MSSYPGRSVKYRILVTIGILGLALAGGCGSKQEEQSQSAVDTSTAAAAEVNKLADELLEHLRSTSAYVRMLSNLPVSEIDDFTFERAQQEADFSRSALSRLQAVQIDGLPQDQWLLAKLLEHTYETGVHTADDYWLNFLVTPYSGGQTVLAVHQVLRSQTIAGKADLHRYLKLVDEYAAMIDQMAAKTRAQAERGIRVPKAALTGVRATLTGLRGAAPAALDVAGARLEGLDGSTTADVEAFRTELSKRVKERVTPAYDRLLAVFDSSYATAAPDKVGLSQYPGGKETYLRLIVYGTGLSLTPQEIHERGLATVADLDARKRAIREQLKFEGDREAFHDMLRSDSRFLAKTPADVERRYRSYVERMAPKIPEYFSVLPKAPYGVKRLDPAAEPGMTYGYYEQPSPANPAGTYYYNGSNLGQRSLATASHLIYHELIPGHHLHLALQTEKQDVHPVRRFMLFGAFNEGWAEYAASLAHEMDLYQDPYDHYGDLLMQSMLAVRLVVDTGMNYFDWPLDKARAYMKEHTFESDVQIASESLRYSTDLFAQALHYRLGFDQIWTLRKRAEAELGDRFDIRAFHATVIGDGAMPLDVLAEQVDRYIAAARAPRAATQ
jgi:uncharacterized protein (DUF885 family)